MENSGTINLDESNFDREINTDKPVLVDFWAEWCGPCKLIAPLLDEIAREKADAVKVAKVNVDQNQNLSFKYNIRAVPSLLFFKNGQLRDQITGMTSKKDLLDLIMPEMDGFAVLEALRSDASERFLPIVVLTGDISEEAKARALDAGASDFLVKPVSQTEALLRIRNLLEARRLNVVLRNQRAALEDAVRERTAELRGTIAELQAVNQRPHSSSALSGV